MSFESWQAFYYAGWQWPWALWVAPLAFLLFRAAVGAPAGGVDPAAARFVDRFALLFAAQTMLDPLCTTLLATALDIAWVSLALGLFFVLLGDFRVYWLVFHLASPPGEGGRRALAPGLRRAALFTPLVAVSAGLANAALGLLWDELPGQVLWLIHELAFVGVALWLARRVVPAEVADPRLRATLRGVLGYVAAYYALWAGADVLILAGQDAGWLLRIIPNQLYYAFFVPYVWTRFFRNPTPA